MKLLLEEETGTGEDKAITLVKEITDIKEAKSGQYVHYCYHGDLLADGKSVKPCRRVKI